MISLGAMAQSFGASRIGLLLGFRVLGLGLGFSVLGLGFWVLGLGFGV